MRLVLVYRMYSGINWLERVFILPILLKMTNLSHKLTAYDAYSMLVELLLDAETLITAQ